MSDPLMENQDANVREGGIPDQQGKSPFWTTKKMVIAAALGVFAFALLLDGEDSVDPETQAVTADAVMPGTSATGDETRLYAPAEESNIFAGSGEEHVTPQNPEVPPAESSLTPEEEQMIHDQVESQMSVVY